MSQTGVEAKLVGWFDTRFKNLEEVEFDEVTLREQENIVYGEEGKRLRRLHVEVGPNRVLALKPFFNEDAPAPETKKRTDGVRVSDFLFQEGERFQHLRLYFSFGAARGDVFAATERPEGGTRPSPGARPGGETSELGGSESQQARPREGEDIKEEMLTPEQRQADKDPDEEDWGLKMAQLCGLEFKTTKNRKFKCVALNRMLFKTPYDVDVGTGICRGVLLKRKPSDPKVIKGTGFLFQKESESSSESDEDLKTRISNVVKFGKAVVKKAQAFYKAVLDRARRTIWALTPPFVLTLLIYLRAFFVHVIVPLYDIVSDLVAAYYYLDKEVIIITALILFFVLLPHIIHSVVLIIEMILDLGEFDEYPKFLVKFYKSKPTRFNLLNHILKFLTLPLLTLLNFMWFFGSMIYYVMGLFVNGFFALAEGLAERFVGKRHKETIREENVREDAWSKAVLMELVFETIPQLVTQVAALVYVYRSEHSIRNYAIMSSIALSLINFVQQCWIIHGFMRVTTLTVFNTVRIILSSALDFFPIFNLYRGTAERVVIQFFNNPILLELWGPLKSIMRHNRTLKALSIYLEETKDWMEMSLDLMDAVDSEGTALEMIDVTVQEANAETNQKIEQRLGQFKGKFTGMLKKGRVKKVYFLADAALNMGLLDIPVEQADVRSTEIDGIKYSWDWPKEKTSRVEYCMELSDTPAAELPVSDPAPEIPASNPAPAIPATDTA